MQRNVTMLDKLPELCAPGWKDAELHSVMASLTTLPEVGPPFVLAAVHPQSPIHMTIKSSCSGRTTG